MANHCVKAVVVRHPGWHDIYIHDTYTHTTPTAALACNMTRVTLDEEQHLTARYIVSSVIAMPFGYQLIE